MPTKKKTLSSLRPNTGTSYTGASNTDSNCAYGFLSREVQYGISRHSFPGTNLTVEIRPFSQQEDMPVIYNWMRLQYGGGMEVEQLPPDGLMETYGSMLESDYVRPFMGMLNEVPVCEIEIFKASKDALNLCYAARSGDYGIHLLLAPLVNQDHLLLLMQTWLEYLFSFREVERIVVDIELGDDWQSVLFLKAGFAFNGKVSQPFREADLYICTRESFRPFKER